MKQESIKQQIDLINRRDQRDTDEDFNPPVGLLSNAQKMEDGTAEKPDRHSGQREDNHNQENHGNILPKVRPAVFSG